MDDGDDDDDDNDDDDILMVTKLTSQGRQLLIYRKLSMLWIVKNDFCQVGIAFPWTFTNTQSLMWWSSVSKIKVLLGLRIAVPCCLMWIKLIINERYKDTTLLLTSRNRESVCIVDREHRKHAIMVEIPKASSAIGRDMGAIKVLHTTKEEHFKESIFSSFFVFVSFQIYQKSGVAKNKIELVVSCTFHDKGSRPVRKVQFFLTLFKRPLPPPPFYLNICPILQGVFFKRVFEH